MIIDDDTNAVIVSDKLHENFQTFSNELTVILLNAGILVKQLNNTSDIWCRDYLPIQINDEKFVQFVYNPLYLFEYPQLRTDPLKLKLPFPRTPSSLTLDGGNVVRWKNKVIVTDAVFDNNPDKSKSDITNMLITQLAIEELIIIPRQPYDIFGHADGMVRFLDENTVLVNNYSMESQHFQSGLYSTLRKHQLDIIKFPYYYDSENKSNRLFNANGCYINYLHAGNTLILPSFNHHYDEIACRILENLFPTHDLHTIDAVKIANHGGVLNCVCWNFKY